MSENPFAKYAERSENPFAKYSVEPAQPEDQRGNSRRGLDEAFQQLPQTGYGLLAGIGAAAENVFGEGGIATGIKKAGVAGFSQWSDRIASTAKESDSWNYSYDKAKEGDFSALVAWLGHGLGYVGGQGLQTLATAGIGAVGGKMVIGAAANQIAKGMVAKEVAQITATAGAASLSAEQIAKEATKNVAGRIGQMSALGASAVGMEGGEIFGDLTAEAAKEGRQLSGAELGKAFAATLAAGSLEFVGDKIGLDIALGRSGLFKPAASAKGIGGRLARGGLGVAGAAPIEGGTEFGQTLLEEWGKGKDPFSAESISQAKDAAALGVLGGTVIGGVGGALHRPSSPEAKPPAETPRGLIGYSPDPFIGFPDGTVGKRADVDRYVAGLPESDQAAARAKLLGLAPQTVDPVAGILDPSRGIDDSINDAMRAVGFNVPRIPIGSATEIPGRQTGGTPEVEANQALPLAEAFPVLGEIPVGEATAHDILPVGEATEIAPSIPTGEANELLPVGEATDYNPDAGMVPRRNTGAVPLDLSGRLAAHAYINQLADVNTPASRAYVQDYRAGRVTPDDVLARIAGPQVAPELTPDERIASSAAQAPKSTLLPTDLVKSDGTPYLHEASAKVRAYQTKGGVIEVPGGFAVRPKETANVLQSDVPATAGLDSAAVTGRAPDSQPSIGPVGPVADGARGPSDATAGTVVGSSAGPATAGSGSQPNTALTAGTKITLDGKAWTVANSSASMVTLDDGAGMTKALLPGSRTYEKIIAQNPAVAADKGAAPANAQPAQPAAPTLTRAEATAPAVAAVSAEAGPAVVHGTASEAVEAAGLSERTAPQVAPQQDAGKGRHAKFYESLIGRKGTKQLSSSGGRTLYRVMVTPAMREKYHDRAGIFGVFPESGDFELRPAGDVTGNPGDSGYILIDKREQMRDRRGAETASAADAAANAVPAAPAPRTSAETAPAVAVNDKSTQHAEPAPKSEQVTQAEATKAEPAAPTTKATEPAAKEDIAAPYTALEGRMVEQPVEAEGASVLRRRDAAKALIKLDERESGLKSLLKCLRGGS